MSIQNTPLQILKVPKGLFKKANETGFYDLLIKWYKLKSLNIQGHFKWEGYISYLSKKLEISSKTLYAVLAKMIKYGWIRKEKTGFYLCSYNFLFSFFQYDLKYKKKNKGYRKGEFKIFKIKCKFDIFLELVSLKEINYNLKIQKQVILKKISNLDREIKKELNSLMQNVPLEEFVEHIKDKFNINLFPTLSCRGISYLLGFNSSSIGYKIEKNLLSLKMIKIKKMKDKNSLPMCSIINFSPIFLFLFKEQP